MKCRLRPNPKAYFLWVHGRFYWGWSGLWMGSPKGWIWILNIQNPSLYGLFLNSSSGFKVSLLGFHKTSGS